jgi:sugar lactone lactonase YvrE
MWESSWQTDSLVMFTPTARNDSGGASPSAVLVSTALSSAEGLTFDGHGNLWVANCNGHTIVEFTPAQLAAAGTQTPAVTITGGSYVDCPWSVTFDSVGNAWVTDLHNPHLVRYSAAQLTTSATPVPADTIGANAGSLTGTVAASFDGSGNLWVTNSAGNVVEYTPAQLAAGGAPTPTVTLTVSSANRLFGAAFDNRGTLWIADAGSSALYGVTKAQLASSGSVTPSIVETVTLGGGFSPEQPVFDPFVRAVGAPAARGHTPAGYARSVHVLNRNGMR